MAIFSATFCQHAFAIKCNHKVFAQRKPKRDRHVCFSSSSQSFSLFSVSFFQCVELEHLWINRTRLMRFITLHYMLCYTQWLCDCHRFKYFAFHSEFSACGLICAVLLFAFRLCLIFHHRFSFWLCENLWNIFPVMQVYVRNADWWHSKSKMKWVINQIDEHLGMN